MSVDKLAVYDNVKGVFADLDDGGLTNDEAIEQIRELVGAKPKLPKHVVYTYLIPVEVRVNLEEGSVEAAEWDRSGGVWGPLPNQTIIDADTSQDVDREIADEVEEKIKAITEDGGWQYDITQI